MSFSEKTSGLAGCEIISSDRDDGKEAALFEKLF
jgi:hypothetical protein